MPVQQARRPCDHRSLGVSPDGFLLMHAGGGGGGQHGGWSCWPHFHLVLELELRANGDWVVSATCPHLHHTERTALACRDDEENR